MGNTNIEFNINRGRKDKLTSTSGNPWNEDGALLFMTDTNELFYNVGKITNDNDATNNRRQINAGYTNAIGNKETGSYTYDQLKKKYEDLENSITNQSNNKMDKVNPTGTGKLSIGAENTSNVATSGAIGTGLNLQGNNALAIGLYNSPNANDLFAIGCGSSTSNRKNALVVRKGDTNNNSLTYLITEGNIYIGSQSTANKVITQNSLENTTSLKNYPTKTEMNTELGKVVSSAFFLNNGIPDSTVSADRKKQLCIDTSRGNGVLCYWNGSEWKEISAVYT